MSTATLYGGLVGWALRPPAQTHKHQENGGQSPPYRTFVLVLPAEAGIQRLKSLGYEIHPCISSCGPAIGCSLKLMDSILNITFSVMARRASHRDVTSKFNPIEFSPAKNMPE